MSTAMPSQERSAAIRTIVDAYHSLRDRLSRTRPAGPSQERVRRYLETGSANQTKR